MPLPFIKPRPVGAMITNQLRKPDSIPGEDESDDSDAGLQSAASDLIEAIHSKDVKSVTEALKSFYELVDNDEEQPEEDEQSDMGDQE